MIPINRTELVIEMGNEDYEVVDKLESIAKSLKSLAESHERIADILEWMAKEKGIVNSDKWALQEKLKKRLRKRDYEKEITKKGLRDIFRAEICLKISETFQEIKGHKSPGNLMPLFLLEKLFFKYWLFYNEWLL